MIRYDKNSLKAEEFINDGEILDSLKFADENKNNLELVDKIIEKARLKKGINHREATTLPVKLRRIFTATELSCSPLSIFQTTA